MRKTYPLSLKLISIIVLLAFIATQNSWGYDRSYLRVKQKVEASATGTDILHSVIGLSKPVDVPSGRTPILTEKLPDSYITPALQELKQHCNPIYLYLKERIKDFYYTENLPTKAAIHKVPFLDTLVFCISSDLKETLESLDNTARTKLLTLVLFQVVTEFYLNETEFNTPDINKTIASLVMSDIYYTNLIPSQVKHPALRGILSSMDKPLLDFFDAFKPERGIDQAEAHLKTLAPYRGQAADYSKIIKKYISPLIKEPEPKRDAEPAANVLIITDNAGIGQVVKKKLLETEGSPKEDNIKIEVVSDGQEATRVALTANATNEFDRIIVKISDFYTNAIQMIDAIQMVAGANDKITYLSYDVELTPEDLALLTQA